MLHATQDHGMTLPCPLPAHHADVCAPAALRGQHPLVQQPAGGTSTRIWRPGGSSTGADWTSRCSDRNGGAGWDLAREANGKEGQVEPRPHQHRRGTEAQVLPT